MKWVVAITLGLASTALAADELVLELPPTGWTEQPDPLAPRSPSQASRFFVKNDDPEVELRLVSDTTLRLDYSASAIAEISRRLVAAQSKPGLTPLKASQPTELDVQGMTVWSFQVFDDARTSTLFYLPSEGGDRVLTYTVRTGHASNLEPIVELVRKAKGLRPPASPLVQFAALAIGVLGAISLAFRRIRRRR